MTKVAVWLGNATPLRSVRWLDGALAVAAKLGSATAIAAGETTWLDLACDRASRAGIESMGIRTKLELDYLGWAQIVAAAVRELDATTVLVDEVSRPERFPEVAAIAEMLDIAQLTRVVSLERTRDVLQATRINGRELQTIRVRGPAVIGVRIAGPALDEYPTPMPSASMKRVELKALGLDPVVLGHRAIPPRGNPQVKKTVEHICEHLAFHLVPRGS